MSNSTVSGNFVPGGVGISPIRGAGIWNAGTLTMINSTVSGNTFPQAGINHEGGGIGNEGTVTIINSTITDNRGSFSNLEWKRSLRSWAWIAHRDREQQYGR